MQDVDDFVAVRIRAFHVNHVELPVCFARPRIGDRVRGAASKAFRCQFLRAVGKPLTDRLAAVLAFGFGEYSEGRIPHRRRLLADPAHVGMDERQFTRVFRPRKRHFVRRLLAPKALFEEMDSTPGGSRIFADGQLGPSE